MSCAGLLVVLLLAWIAPALGEPAGPRLYAPASGETAAHPIDLTAGFHSPPMPPSGEDVRLPAIEQPESFPEPVARSPGLPRSLGMMSKREHVARFQLHGVTLFGGSIAGSVDSRSAHIQLSWPINP
jgi:hypothetical protein